MHFAGLLDLGAKQQQEEFREFSPGFQKAIWGLIVRRLALRGGQTSASAARRSNLSPRDIVIVYAVLGSHNLFRTVDKISTLKVGQC